MHEREESREMKSLKQFGGEQAKKDYFVELESNKSSFMGKFLKHFLFYPLRFFFITIKIFLPSKLPSAQSEMIVGI